jgi:hypothetical protein
MVAFKGNHVEGVPLATAVGNLKTVDLDFWELTQSFFG